MGKLRCTVQIRAEVSLTLVSENLSSMKHLNYDYKALFTQKVVLVLSKMVILSYFRYSPTSIIPSIPQYQFTYSTHCFLYIS